MKKILSWKNLCLLLVVALALPTLTALAGVDDDVNVLVGRQNSWYFENQPLHFYPFSAERELKLQADDIMISTLYTTWTVFTVQGLGPIDMCESRGFGIPYGAQLTSPSYDKQVDNGRDANETLEMPQNEPGGTYKDGVTTSQTIVVCNRGGQMVAEVHEEDATVYMTPVHLEMLADGVHQRLVHDPGIAPVTIDVDAINAESQGKGAPSEQFPAD